MSIQVRALEPKVLWNHFADLNAVPRPSKKEEKVIAFIRAFGEGLQLPTTIDEAGNVIIKKPATKGLEDRPVVVIQSHLDMVHQKNSDSNFDFTMLGIDMYVDGDFVKARGTTLGADNGIGVASIMALLSFTDIPHPALEALFTIDEETGMTGALSLKGGLLNGSVLLNLDTEDDRELIIGCAGGIDVTGNGKYEQRSPEGNTALKITLKSLTGGHSGIDIHKGRANANVLMNDLLLDLQEFRIEIASVDGGSLRNAIPRESVAVIVFHGNEEKNIQSTIDVISKKYSDQFSSTDPNLSLTTSSAEVPEKVMPEDDQRSFLNSLKACQNGVYRMDPNIPELVQTSNNIAKVLLKDGEWSVQCLTRSSVDDEKMELANQLKYALEKAGAKVIFGVIYPGWKPRPDASVVKLASNIYEEMFGEKPHVNAVHAGLECGIIGKNYPDMEMISFGPNITGAHSPDEQVQVSSVERFWKYLLGTLEKI